MNELETWEYLAKKWSTKIVTRYGNAFVQIGSADCSGICSCLGVLLVTDKITRQVHESCIESMMRERKATNETIQDYWWPTDYSGVIHRAEFCHKMAAYWRKEYHEEAIRQAEEGLAGQTKQEVTDGGILRPNHREGTEQQVDQLRQTEQAQQEIQKEEG